MPKKKAKGTNIDIAALLRDKGLKVTLPRVALLNVLTAEHGPFTAEELHSKVSEKQSDGNCDLVTVYRCIEKFENVGLIDRCNFGDGATRYEMRSKNHHHHIICRRCRRVEPVHTCPIEEGDIKTPKNGFKKITHRLEFFGTCPDCID